MLLNNLLEVLKNSNIYNFAGGNIILVASKYRDILLETLKSESQSAMNWFRDISMIVNTDKSQLMPLKKSPKKVIQKKLKIDNNEIESENSVTLLGITIEIKRYIQTEEIHEPKRF